MFSIAFEPEHLSQIDTRDYERGFVAEITDLTANARELAENGPALSFVETDIIASGGIINLQRGVGDAWLSLSKSFTIDGPSKRWVRLTRLIELELSRLDFRRIQTAIPVGFKPGHRFARHMGFVSEGIMRSYGHDGSDYERFARVQCRKPS